MKAEVKTAGDKLNEALKKADNAVKDLKSMGENAKSAITEDVTSLKGVLAETNVAKSIEKAKEKVVAVAETSVDKAKEFGEKMDENVHARPYNYIAGAAVAGLILGILFRRKN